MGYGAKWQLYSGPLQSLPALVPLDVNEHTIYGL
jgi:hypothetical protein